MLRCSKCNRVTKKGEPTANFIIYVRKKYPNESIGIESESEIKTCFECSGSVLRK